MNMDVAVRMIEKVLGPGLFLETLTQIGTFVGAISGVRLASMKRFDWFGAYVIGCITALGGGTLRDVLMQQPPFWINDPSYLVTCFLAVVAVGLFGRRFISEQITWFVFDTIAISIFMVIGMEKIIALEAATPLACWWKAILMGVITAVFGGVLRDICINEVPLIFRKEIYALACAAGGAVYFGLLALGVDSRICSVVCIVTIFVTRALSIKYRLGMPVLIGRHTIIHLPRHVHRKPRGGEKPRAKTEDQRGIERLKSEIVRFKR